MNLFNKNRIAIIGKRNDLKAIFEQQYEIDINNYYK